MNSKLSAWNLSLQDRISRDKASSTGQSLSRGLPFDKPSLTGSALHQKGLLVRPCAWLLHASFHLSPMAINSPPYRLSSANAGATEGEDVSIILETNLVVRDRSNNQHVMEENVDKLQIFSEGFTRTVF